MRRLAVLVASAVVVASCVGSPSPSTTSAATSTSSPSPSSTLPQATTTTTWAADPNFAFGIGVDCVPEFDPIVVQHSISECPDYGVPEQPSLYRLVPPTSSLVPMLSADENPPSGEETADGWVIVVNLAPWVKWSDGSAVDAADVVYSFKAMKGTRFWGLPGSPLVDVKEVDSSTVRLIWERRPTVDEWQLGVGLAPIVSADFWSDQPERSQPGFPIDGLDARQIPTTGAYRLADFDPATGWTLEAVPDWWESTSTYQVWANGAVHYQNPQAGIDKTYGQPSGDVVAEWTVGPYAARVEYVAMGDVFDRRVALTDGVVDMLFGPTSIGLTDPAISLTGTPVASRTGVHYWVALETRIPPFDSVAARRALVCEMDLDFLANRVLGGAVSAPDGWGVGLGAWWADATPACDNEPNPTLWENTHIKGLVVRPGTDPIATTAVLWVYNWLNDLGASVLAGGPLPPAGPDIFYEDDGQFVVLSSSIHLADLIDDQLPLIPDITGWRFDEYESLLEQRANTYDIETAQEDLRAIQEVLARELPAAPLFHLTQIELFDAERIEPPFLTPTEDRLTTTLVGGFQAWPGWVIAATKQAPA